MRASALRDAHTLDQEWMLLSIPGTHPPAGFRTHPRVARYRCRAQSFHLSRTLDLALAL